MKLIAEYVNPTRLQVSKDKVALIERETRLINEFNETLRKLESLEAQLKDTKHSIFLLNNWPIAYYENRRFYDRIFNYLHENEKTNSIRETKEESTGHI